MPKFLAVAGASALALALMSAPALAYERYSFMYGNNTWTEFEGPDGAFSINSGPVVRACDGDNYKTFFNALFHATHDPHSSGLVLLQTYTCGNYIKVCVDPDAYDDSFNPESCATFVWDHNQD